MSDQFFIDLNFVPIERFDMAQFYKYTDNYDPLTSAFQNQLISLSPNGTYFIQGNDERPDIISYRIYKDTQYWWMLMMYNGLSDVYQIKSGVTISFPSISDLEDLLFSLKSQESASQAVTG